MHLPFYLFLASEKDPDLCIKYRLKKPKPEKRDKVPSEKKEKQHSSSKDDVSDLFEGSFICLFHFFSHLFLSFSNTLKNWNNFDKMNVYVPCRVSVRDQGELVVNVLHVLGRRIVDSVTSARYCVTKQNLLQDEASPWENFYLNSVKHSCLISPPGLLQSLGKEEISF